MQPRRVAVLGGRPGPLYAVRSLQADHDDREVGGATPHTLRDIVGAAYRHDMTLQAGGRTVRGHNDRLIGIARTELLAVLQRHTEKAGVRLEFGRRPRGADLGA